MPEETIIEAPETTQTQETAAEETLLGASKEEQTVEQKAAADKVVADEKAKAEALAKETPEQKTTREAKEKADAIANTVPEKYEIKAPEGMSIDPVVVDKMTPLFKELKLTSAQAQKLVDTYAPIVKGQIETQQKAAIDYWNKETENWKFDTLKILGANAPKELAFAAKVINKVGTKYKTEDGKEGNKLRDILEETRVGNHPEITRLFIQIGKLISEDSFVDPSKQSSGPAVSLYDHPTSIANLKR